MTAITCPQCDWRYDLPPNRADDTTIIDATLRHYDSHSGHAFTPESVTSAIATIRATVDEPFTPGPKVWGPQ